MNIIICHRPSVSYNFTEECPVGDFQMFFKFYFIWICDCGWAVIIYFFSTHFLTTCLTQPKYIQNFIGQGQQWRFTDGNWIPLSGFLCNFHLLIPFCVLSISNPHKCLSQLFPHHLNTCVGLWPLFSILSARGSTLDVRFWRLKSIPALKE